MALQCLVSFERACAAKARQAGWGRRARAEGRASEKDALPSSSCPRLQTGANRYLMNGLDRFPQDEKHKLLEKREHFQVYSNAGFLHIAAFFNDTLHTHHVWRCYGVFNALKQSDIRPINECPRMEAIRVSLAFRIKRRDHNEKRGMYRLCYVCFLGSPR